MSKPWIVCLVAVLGVGMSSTVLAAPVPARPVVQAAKLTPENIDGSKANSDTQNKVAKLSKRYGDALAANDVNGRANVFAEMKALYATDSKNLALITWLGFAALQENQYELASEVLQSARGKSRSPEVNANNDRNLAVAYHNLRRYQDEVVLLSGVPQLDEEGLAMLASAYIGLNDFKGAAGAYESLKVKRPLDPKELSNYAIALGNINDPKAPAVIAEAVKADPANYPLVESAATNLVAANRYDDAIRLVETAGGPAEGNKPVRNIYARALARRGTNDDLLKAAAVVEKLGPDAEVSTRFDLGTAALKTNQFDLAVKALSGLDDPKSLNNLGRAYEGQGKWDLAAEAYGKASDRQPNESLYAKNASVAYAKVNNEAAAAKYAERGGIKPTTQFDLARVQGLLANRKYDEALTLMDELEPKFQGSAPFYFNKGVVYQKKGDYQKAVECYRKSRAIREEDATIKNLTVALYQAGDYAGARIEAETYIRRVGRTPEALQNLGAIAAAQNRWDEAVAIWKELLKGNENTVARLDLADALWNMGNTQEARFHYGYVLKTEPGNARAQNGMGLYWLSLSKLKEAETAFRAAVNADRSFATGYYNLGIALERQNRMAEARAAFTDALGARPDYPEAKRALQRIGG